MKKLLALYNIIKGVLAPKAEEALLKAKQDMHDIKCKALRQTTLGLAGNAGHHTSAVVYVEHEGTRYMLHYADCLTDDGEIKEKLWKGSAPKSKPTQGHDALTATSSPTTTQQVDAALTQLVKHVSEEERRTVISIFREDNQGGKIVYKPFATVDGETQFLVPHSEFTVAIDPSIVTSSYREYRKHNGTFTHLNSWEERGLWHVPTDTLVGTSQHALKPHIETVEALFDTLFTALYDRTQAAPPNDDVSVQDVANTLPHLHGFLVPAPEIDQHNATDAARTMRATLRSVQVKEKTDKPDPLNVQVTPSSPAPTKQSTRAEIERFNQVAATQRQQEIAEILSEYTAFLDKLNAQQNFDAVGTLRQEYGALIKKFPNTQDSPYAQDVFSAAQAQKSKIKTAWEKFTQDNSKHNAFNRVVDDILRTKQLTFDNIPYNAPIGSKINDVFTYMTGYNDDLKLYARPLFEATFSKLIDFLRSKLPALSDEWQASLQKSESLGRSGNQVAHSCYTSLFHIAQGAEQAFSGMTPAHKPEALPFTVETLNTAWEAHKQDLKLHEKCTTFIQKFSELENTPQSLQREYDELLAELGEPVEGTLRLHIKGTLTTAWEAYNADFALLADVEALCKKLNAHHQDIDAYKATQTANEAECQRLFEALGEPVEGTRRHHIKGTLTTAWEAFQRDFALQAHVTAFCEKLDVKCEDIDAYKAAQTANEAEYQRLLGELGEPAEGTRRHQIKGTLTTAWEAFQRDLQLLRQYQKFIASFDIEGNTPEKLKNDYSSYLALSNIPTEPAEGTRRHQIKSTLTTAWEEYNADFALQAQVTAFCEKLDVKYGDNTAYKAAQTENEAEYQRLLGELGNPAEGTRRHALKATLEEEWATETAARSTADYALDKAVHDILADLQHKPLSSTAAPVQQEDLLQQQDQLGTSPGEHMEEQRFSASRPQTPTTALDVEDDEVPPVSPDTDLETLKAALNTSSGYVQFVKEKLAFTEALGKHPKGTSAEALKEQHAALQARELANLDNLDSRLEEYAQELQTSFEGQKEELQETFSRFLIQNEAAAQKIFHPMTVAQVAPPSTVELKLEESSRKQDTPAASLKELLGLLKGYFTMNLDASFQGPQPGQTPGKQAHQKLTEWRQAHQDLQGTTAEETVVFALERALLDLLVSKGENLDAAMLTQAETCALNIASLNKSLGEIATLTNFESLVASLNNWYGVAKTEFDSIRGDQAAPAEHPFDAPWATFQEALKAKGANLVMGVLAQHKETFPPDDDEAFHYADQDKLEAAQAALTALETENKRLTKTPLKDLCAGSDNSLGTQRFVLEETITQLEEAIKRGLKPQTPPSPAVVTSSHSSRTATAQKPQGIPYTEFVKLKDAFLEKIDDGSNPTVAYADLKGEFEGLMAQVDQVTPGTENAASDEAQILTIKQGIQLMWEEYTTALGTLAQAGLKTLATLSDEIGGLTQYTDPKTSNAFAEAVKRIDQELKALEVAGTFTDPASNLVGSYATQKAAFITNTTAALPTLLTAIETALPNADDATLAQLKEGFEALKGLGGLKLVPELLQGDVIIRQLAKIQELFDKRAADACLKSLGKPVISTHRKTAEDARTKVSSEVVAQLVQDGHLEQVMLPQVPTPDHEPETDTKAQGLQRLLAGIKWFPIVEQADGQTYAVKPSLDDVFKTHCQPRGAKSEYCQPVSLLSTVDITRSNPSDTKSMKKLKPADYTQTTFPTCAWQAHECIQMFFKNVKDFDASHSDHASLKAKLTKVLTQPYFDEKDNKYVGLSTVMNHLTLCIKYAQNSKQLLEALCLFSVLSNIDAIIRYALAVLDKYHDRHTDGADEAQLDLRDFPDLFMQQSQELLSSLDETSAKHFQRLILSGDLRQFMLEYPLAETQNSLLQLPLSVKVQASTESATLEEVMIGVTAQAYADYTQTQYDVLESTSKFPEHVSLLTTAQMLAARLVLLQTEVKQTEKELDSMKAPVPNTAQFFSTRNTLQIQPALKAIKTTEEHLESKKGAVTPLDVSSYKVGTQVTDQQKSTLQALLFKTFGGSTVNMMDAHSAPNAKVVEVTPPTLPISDLNDKFESFTNSSSGFSVSQNKNILFFLKEAPGILNMLFKVSNGSKKTLTQQDKQNIFRLMESIGFDGRPSSCEEITISDLIPQFSSIVTEFCREIFNAAEKIRTFLSGHSDIGKPEDFDLLFNATARQLGLPVIDFRTILEDQAVALETLFFQFPRFVQNKFYATSKTQGTFKTWQSLTAQDAPSLYEYTVDDDDWGTLPVEFAYIKHANNVQQTLDDIHPGTALTEDQAAQLQQLAQTIHTLSQTCIDFSLQALEKMRTYNEMLQKEKEGEPTHDVKRLIKLEEARLALKKRELWVHISRLKQLHAQRSQSAAYTAEGCLYYTPAIEAAVEALERMYQEAFPAKVPPQSTGLQPQKPAGPRPANTRRTVGGDKSPKLSRKPGALSLQPSPSRANGSRPGQLGSTPTSPRVTRTIDGSKSPRPKPISTTPSRKPAVKHAFPTPDGHQSMRSSGPTPGRKPRTGVISSPLKVESVSPDKRRDVSLSRPKVDSPGRGAKLKGTVGKSTVTDLHTGRPVVGSPTKPVNKKTTFPPVHKRAQNSHTDDLKRK